MNKSSQKLLISVILPVYNGEQTLDITLKSLFSQTIKADEIIAINDFSTDTSKEKLEFYFKRNPQCRIINHKKNKGLAKSYNEAISKSKGDLIIIIHQDVEFPPETFFELIKPFSDENVLACGHTVVYPFKQWKTYNFWQKCFFARFVGKKTKGINGQADCFRKRALLKVGMFNERDFRTAGEDADMIFKLKKIGKVVNSKAEIIHLHKASKDFSLQHIIFKQMQYSESRGVLLRKGQISDPKDFFSMFFRELLILSLFFPLIAYVGAILIIFYSFWYTRAVYVYEYKNPRIIILPFFNIYLLFISFFYTLSGFIYGKQKL